MIGNRQFVFHPIMSVAALIALCILVSLGVWQLQRLEWKNALIEAVESRLDAAPVPISDALAIRNSEADGIEYLPVKLSGKFVDGYEARVFGAVEAKPGVFLFHLFQTAEGIQLFVNRGFVPQTELTEENQFQPSEDIVTIEGLWRETEKLSPPASWLKASSISPGGLWLRRDPAAFARHLETDAADYYIDAFQGEPGPWPKGGVTRVSFSNKHFEYALTWFGLALTLIGVWLAVSFSRVPATPQTDHGGPAA